jgi:hypothetical protein
MSEKQQNTMTRKQQKLCDTNHRRHANAKMIAEGKFSFQWATPLTKIKNKFAAI